MSNESDFTPKGTGTDDKVMIGDDLKEESKDTLAAYLSSLTTNASTRNAFPISPDSPREEFTLTQATGEPSEFVTGGQDGTEGFTDTFPEGDNTSGAAVSKFDTLSNSRRWTRSGPGQLGDILDKNAQTDGNNLLRDVRSTEEPYTPGVGNTSGQTAFPDASEATPMQQRVSQILRNGNRFDPTPGSSPYIEDGEFTEPGIPYEQGQFGVYDEDADRTTIRKLAKVAGSIMLRSTGHARAATADPTSAAIRASTVLPNRVQIGAKKIDTLKLRPLNAYGAPDKVFIEGGELEYNDVDGSPLESQKSYGNLNSYEEKFQTAMISQMGTTVAAVTEYATAALIFAAITTLLETIAAAAPPTAAGDPSSMKKGMWKREGRVLKMMRKLGIPRTRKPMWMCVCYGLAAYFKIPRSMLPPVPSGVPGVGGPAAVAAWWAGLVASAGPDLASIFYNMQYSAGYYATQLRSIRRDMNDLVRDLGSAVPPASAGSPDNVIALFNLLLNMDRYQCWRFYCTMAIMGDKFIAAGNTTDYDLMADTGQTRVIKSRARPSGPALAWRHRSAPASILVNTKLDNAYTLFGYALPGGLGFASRVHNLIGDTNSMNAANPYSGGINGSKRRKVALGPPGTHMSRLSRAEQISIENELDAEYMPFYLHDLRTNEIISFHAFLTDLSDAYSVSYAESSGYGRIDSVKIYQNTTRDVSVSWTMVATSPEDFDSMWWSVNKLVSMIYPQWSMGKPLQAGAKKFIMPFSQIPTASPVIRLRVGDVIRSNYSRFNLARLFGLAEAKPALPTGSPADEISAAPFDITAQAMVENAEANQAREAEEEERRNERRFAEEPATVADAAHGYLPGDPDWSRAILKASSRGYYTQDDGEGLYSGEPPGAICYEHTPFTSRTSAPGEVVVLDRWIVDPSHPDAADEEPWAYDGNTTSAHRNSRHAEYAVRYIIRDDEADPYRLVSAKNHWHTYIVTSMDLEPIMPTVAPDEADIPDVSLTQQVNDIYDFFDPRNNAIVRSFEAAGGRGLAGVITSFDMDWGEAQWDMSDLGRRAPTMMTVSIGFSPIHDIIPGLDNNGMMRALNYPVGKISAPLATDYFDPGAPPSGVSIAPYVPAVRDLRSANRTNVRNFRLAALPIFASTTPGGGPPGTTP